MEPWTSYQSADSPGCASFNLKRLVLGSLSGEKKQPHPREDQDEPVGLGFHSERPKTGDLNVFL